MSNDDDRVMRGDFVFDVASIGGVPYPVATFTTPLTSYPVLTRMPPYDGPPPTRQQRREWLQERLDTIITEIEKRAGEMRDIITEMETLNDE